MEAPEIWASMYVVPVIGVFVLAGAVYFLSFRSKEDDDQSLRIYLNVLSGDDDKNRKAAKKLRKFGTQKKSAIGSGGNGDGDNKQVDSDAENPQPAAASISTALLSKPIQLVNKKADPAATTCTVSVTPVMLPNVVVEPKSAPPTSQSPEVGDDDGTNSVSTPADEELSREGAKGWLKAVSRKEKKFNSASDNGRNYNQADDTTNHSTTSDESRPSFSKNSCGSRSSSPYRQRITHYPATAESRKFTSRKTLTKPPQLLLQRPDHLKLELNTGKPVAAAAGATYATTTFNLVPRPTILLSKPPEGSVSADGVNVPNSFFSRTSLRTCGGEYNKNVVPPGLTDACIQTEENEEYPSPLEGLRQVDEGEPRFVIMLDFSVQVDLDVEDGLEPELVMRFQDGDKILYSSGGSLSSGDGSARVTPVLDDEYGKEFRVTAEKAQSVHRRNTSHRTNPRQVPHHYPHHLPSDGRVGTGGGGGANEYYGGPHGDLRTFRAPEKGSTASWIDNSSRRGRPLNGRWRN